MSITKKHLLSIILLSVLMKVVYIVFAFSIKQYTGDEVVGSKFNDVLSIFQRNDSYWYKEIVKHGYQKIKNPIELGYVGKDKVIQSSWAMFPVYPLTIKGISTLFQLNFIQSAFIISLLFSALSYILFYIICTSLFSLSAKIAWRNTLIFIVFPFHYYFSMYYTEAMYFSFLAIAFLSIHHRKYWLLCLTLIPLTLVRPNGIVSVLPLFLYFLEKEGGYPFWLNQLKTFNLKRMLSFGWFLSAPISLIIYCLYQKHMTNFYFAYVKAQVGWNKDFMFPLLALFRSGDLSSQFNSVYTILVFVFSFLIRKKIPLSFNILVWISLLLPLSSGSVLSMPRFISILFPLFVLLGSKISIQKYYIGIIVLLLAFHFWSFYPWLISSPFSY
jgi:hypothetical protein